MRACGMGEGGMCTYMCMVHMHMPHTSSSRPSLISSSRGVDGDRPAARGGAAAGVLTGSTLPAEADGRVAVATSAAGVTDLGAAHVGSAVGAAAGAAGAAGAAAVDGCCGCTAGHDCCGWPGSHGCGCGGCWVCEPGCHCGWG